MNITNRSSVVAVMAHPDDIKNCTGVLLRALKEGGRATLIQVTRGEGFNSNSREAALEMGALRQRELLDFLGRVGLGPERTAFLGFPNSRGLLAALREDYYRVEGQPFFDPLLGTDRVIYEDAYRCGIPFFGEQLLDILKELFDQARPTDVFTHHPKDNHDDHRAMAFFVKKAVHEMMMAGRRPRDVNCWASLVYYARWRWPPPGESFSLPGLEQEFPSMPIERFPLTAEECRTKTAACREVFAPTLSLDYINQYMKREEIFWRL